MQSYRFLLHKLDSMFRVKYVEVNILRACGHFNYSNRPALKQDNACQVMDICPMTCLDFILSFAR